MSALESRAVVSAHGNHIVDDHQSFGAKGFQAEPGGRGAGLMVVTRSRQRGRRPVLGSSGFDVENIGLYRVVDVRAELSQQAVDPAHDCMRLTGKIAGRFDSAVALRGNAAGEAHLTDAKGMAEG